MKKRASEIHKQMELSIDIDNNVEDPVEEQPDELEFDDGGVDPFKKASGIGTEIIQPQ